MCADGYYIFIFFYNKFPIPYIIKDVYMFLYVSNFICIICIRFTPFRIYQCHSANTLVNEELDIVPPVDCLESAGLKFLYIITFSFEYIKKKVSCYIRYYFHNIC